MNTNKKIENLEEKESLESRRNFKNSIEIRKELFFEKLMTVEELADALGLRPQTIRNWVAMRRLPYLRIGGKTRFRRESLEVWLAEKERQPCQ
ncbi:MAG: helix-turn-helix domain-containing protein [Oligoflexia bacterium]|nr:helix-turn-helix domain-containing protein [Oligoflexia bacterium]